MPELTDHNGTVVCCDCGYRMERCVCHMLPANRCDWCGRTEGICDCYDDRDWCDWCHSPMAMCDCDDDGGIR